MTRSNYGVAEVVALLLFVSLGVSLLLGAALVAGLSLVALLSVLSLVSPVALLSLLPAASSVPTAALLDLRLSVIYQPEPLKTMPTGWKTRRNALAQEGQVRNGSSLKD
jgi:hypothetical protein